MANANDSTLLSGKSIVQVVGVGECVSIPADKLEQAAVILRCLIAIGEDDISHLKDEPYEVLERRLNYYKRNMCELAASAREVVCHG